MTVFNSIYQANRTFAFWEKNLNGDPTLAKAFKMTESNEKQALARSKEVMSQAFSYINLKDLLNCSKICKHWNHFINGNS